jgi:Putative zinc-finger
MMTWRWWTCRRLRPRLVDAAAGTLEAGERARVSAHLARCGRCAADVATLRDFPSVLRGAQEPALGEEFWRSQRAAIMRKVHGLPQPGAHPAREPRRPWIDVRNPWMTWAPALVAAMAVVMVVALRVGPGTVPGPETPATGIEALDDPALLSLSDLSGYSSPEVERTTEVVEETTGPLPELSNDELDALAQLVGVRER